MQNCAILWIFSFTHRNNFSRTSIICDLQLHHIRHKMAQYKVYSYFPSKVVALFWKIFNTIFVNPGQSLRDFVKTESDISSLKINNFKQNLDRRCILTLPIDIYRRKSKNSKIRFFPISWFFLKIDDILGHFGTKIPYRETLFWTHAKFCLL